jgi:stress response protein YsnF
MPALDQATRERWRDMVVVDRDAATVGAINAFYLDRATGEPTWALVETGFLAGRPAFVPLALAVEADGEIRLPYSKAHIREAPRFDPRGELSPDQELALSAHYRLHDHHGAVAEPAAARGQAPTTDAGPVRTPARGPAGTGPVWAPEPGEASTGRSPRPATAPGPATVIRSEEELHVAVRTRLRRLRLRKYVVTEYVTRTFPVRREEVRLEEAGYLEPAGGDPAPRHDPVELVLHREEPVVELRVVPAERVRVVKELVTEERTVTADLRREHVDVREEPAGS